MNSTKPLQIRIAPAARASARGGARRPPPACRAAAGGGAPVPEEPHSPRAFAAAAAALLAGSTLAAPYVAPPLVSAFVGPGQTVERAAKSAQPPPGTATELGSEEGKVVGLFKNATPSVVFVTNNGLKRLDAFSLDETKVPQGSGSGFVWDKSGHVVTNFHVIKGATGGVSVTTAAGDVYDAEVVGGDAQKDLAVLKLVGAPRRGASAFDKAPGFDTKAFDGGAAAGAGVDRLTPLPLGKSSALQVGQRVYAIGNPFGLDHTLTSGLVSGLGRELRGDSGAPMKGVIQTDAAINPGNSGGPLLDSAGRLVGVNTAIFSPSGASAGIGFAIPVDSAAGVVQQLIAYGKVVRGVLGIGIAPDQAARQLGAPGVLVLDVPRDSPAAAAGIISTARLPDGRLRLGDVIVGIDGARVRNSGDLYATLDGKRPGETVKVDLLRDGGYSRGQLDVALASSVPDATA